MAALVALFSSVLWGSVDFFGGVLSKRLAAYAVVGASQAFGLLAVSIAAVATGGFGLPLDWLPWGVAAGVCGSVGLVCFYAALASGTMGVVSPIAALGAIVPVMAGIIAGERPSALTTVGLVVALLGALAASGPELRGAATGRAVGLAVIAGVGFGLALLLIARGAESSTVMTLWGMRVTSVSAFTVVALLLRTTGGVGRADLAPLAAVGVADAGANLLFGLASQMGLLSVTAVLGSLYPVVTVLLAWSLLHERMQRIQVIGVTAALLGVILVSAG